MRKLSFLLLLTLGIAAINGCKKTDPPLPDNLVQFSTGALGFSDDSSAIHISLTLSRAVSTATPVTIGFTATGVTYGTQFTTDPAATGNSLTVTIPAGSTSANFKIVKTENIFLQGTESLSFGISSAGSSVKLGTTDSLKVSFSSIISEGSSLTLNGGAGGSSAANTVFVDFSTNQQTATQRDSWDLGFYSGDDYRVVLNNTLANAMAVAINKNDLTQVTAADTVGMVLSSSFSPDDLLKVDSYTGDITKTAIAAISATDADNKVYILNRSGLTSATGKGWVKIRIIRKGSGYTLQYANIADATFKTVDVTKDATHQFSYVSLTSGAIVPVTPAKGQWDIEWGLASYYTPYNGVNIYYPFSDLVFINNIDGVQAAEVLTSTVSYDAYAEGNIATTTFSSNRDVIGGNWRATQGTIGVKTDRFYVIKDAAGNVYKLKFINFTTQDGGTRGYPNITYAMVKKA